MNVTFFPSNTAANVRTMSARIKSTDIVRTDAGADLNLGATYGTFVAMTLPVGAVVQSGAVRVIKTAGANATIAVGTAAAGTQLRMAAVSGADGTVAALTATAIGTPASTERKIYVTTAGEALAAGADFVVEITYYLLGAADVVQ